MSQRVPHIDASATIPPHIALLLNEDLHELAPHGARKKLRSMTRDLQDQTLVGLSEEWPKPELGSNPRNFNVVLSGGLDLFRREGACAQYECRINYADQIARSIGLMADKVSVHDIFAERLLDLKRPTNEELDELLDEIRLLHRLRPLIEAGILGFRSPMHAFCEGCAGEFSHRVEATSLLLYAELGSTMFVERHPGGAASIHTGMMYDPPVVLLAPPHYATTNSDEQLMLNAVTRCMRSVLWDARDATWDGGTIFSNSKVGLSGLLSQEGRFQGVAQLRALEGHRVAELPWIAGLSIQQTIQLREEASLALPALREFLASRLAARPLSQADRGGEEDYILELRTQAAEVRAELELATTRRPSLARNSIGVLGLSIAALSLATEVAPTVVAFELLTTLGLLHSVSSQSDDHAEELLAKPGYVLVAAERILDHAA